MKLSAWFSVVAFAAIFAATSPARAQQPLIPTPGTACNLGDASFWEQAGICVSNLWQRPAFQFGAATQSCASGTAGMIQWTGSAFQGCDGTSWASLGSGGGTITLGTQASTTNPQRSGDATTGFFTSGASTANVSAGGVEVERWNTLASGVDYVSITPGKSGTDVKIAVAGSTTNQTLDLTPKGTGSVKVVGSIYSPRVALTDASTVAIDWSQGNIQYLLTTSGVGASRTLTFSNPVDGARYILAIKQDATGSRTVTWPATVRWPGGTAPTLTTTANKTDYITFIYNGADTKYDGVAISQNY